ncbi:uncharacterized protein G2W53_041306 [Senna tora]|uniref:Uncharacterized protein n=1 Tax=Senna tora TaxID=362788 RepID=A0A834SDI5_9FABA|nr:uncharacterized protein G2W53_041306 [Senna tora]
MVITKIAQYMRIDLSSYDFGVAKAQAKYDHRLLLNMGYLKIGNEWEPLEEPVIEVSEEEGFSNEMRLPKVETTFSDAASSQRSTPMVEYEYITEKPSKANSSTITFRLSSSQTQQSSKVHPTKANLWATLFTFRGTQSK